MKPITLTDFHNMLYAEFSQLNAVERLLNDEGRATLKATFDLMQRVPFFESIEEYAADNGVQHICRKYANCRSIQTYGWMLDKVRVPFPEVVDINDLYPYKGGAAE